MFCYTMLCLTKWRFNEAQQRNRARFNALRSARKAYMNASVRQHGDDGELHPAIKMIDDEIDRRG